MGRCSSPVMISLECKQDIQSLLQILNDCSLVQFYSRDEPVFYVSI